MCDSLVSLLVRFGGVTKHRVLDVGAMSGFASACEVALKGNGAPQTAQVALFVLSNVRQKVQRMEKLRTGRKRFPFDVGHFPGQQLAIVRQAEMRFSIGRKREELRRTQNGSFGDFSVFQFPQHGRRTSKRRVVKFCSRPCFQNATFRILNDETIYAACVI